MKKLLPFLLILILGSCKKDKFEPSLTKEFSIQSVSNGANYNIKIGLPENYNPAQKYASVYVLDGDENFNFVAENCQKLSGKYLTDNVIVVSIGYGYDRTKDYTPTKANEGDGGAEQFMTFIKNELILKVEEDYSADTTRKSRIILGHSFGGLFAAYAFTNFNSVFGNYLILSPSLWYDNEIMLRYEQENRSQNKNIQQLVFMGLGELESSGRMQSPFEAFYQRLGNNYSNIKLARHFVPGLEHRGSENPDIIEGLTFYFKNK